MKGDFMCNKIDVSADIFKNISRELDKIESIVAEGNMDSYESVCLHMQLRSLEFRVKGLEKPVGEKIKEYESVTEWYLPYL